MLAKWIIEHFPAHQSYVEPFAGAASVLLQKPRVNGELLNDLDGEIVNLFRVLRDPTQARELERLIRLTPYSRSEFEAAYLSASDPIEQARRMIFRSFAGFGADGVTARWQTGFRDNLTRASGTPARDWMKFPDAISAITERLRGVVIESRPAVDLIAKHDSKQTLFYCDPPYPHATRAGYSKRKHSYRFEMTDDDHREFAAAVHRVKGMVVVSGYRCDLYDGELFHDWLSVEKETYSDGARRRTEVLWMNAAVIRQSKQQSLFT